MWQIIEENRFNQINKMVNFLEARNSVRKEFFEEKEGVIMGLRVFDKESNALLTTLFKNNLTGTFFVRED